MQYVNRQPVTFLLLFPVSMSISYMGKNVGGQFDKSVLLLFW